MGHVEWEDFEFEYAVLEDTELEGIETNCAEPN